MPNSVVLYVTKHQKNLMEMTRNDAHFPSHMRYGIKYRRTEQVLEFPNGSKIKALNPNGYNHKGYEFNKVVYDEASKFSVTEIAELETRAEVYSLS